MATIEMAEIQTILPHRYPFLLVDQIIECDMEKRIVGLKNVTVNEPFFQGHFPGHPVMPGVLQLEAMAQIGGILLNKLQNREGLIAYFLAVDDARFRKVVRPGDQLIIEVELLKFRMKMSRVQGRVTVNDELTCEAKLMFGYDE